MRRNRVLVVEDDEGVRDALSLILDIEGYDVTVASDGAEALSLLANMEPPCLILSDLMMPVMDGWTFAGELGKDPRLASIPIVFVTAFAERAASLSKAHRVIRKPVDTDLLIEVVGQYCAVMR
jgi:CheY-like chemotaxis protein